MTPQLATLIMNKWDDASKESYKGQEKEADKLEMLILRNLLNQLEVKSRPCKS